jgi:hypothetical protein
MSTTIEFRPCYGKTSFHDGVRRASLGAGGAAPSPQSTASTAKPDAPAAVASEVSFPVGPQVYERDWLLRFQTALLDAPPQLRTAVTAVVCAPEQQDKLRAGEWQCGCVCYCVCYCVCMQLVCVQLMCVAVA